MSNHVVSFTSLSSWLSKKSAHAHTFGGNFELKILRMHIFSLQFLDSHTYSRCNFWTANLKLLHLKVRLGSLRFQWVHIPSSDHSFSGLP